MSDWLSWVQIRSWHAVRREDAKHLYTYCGRKVKMGFTTDELPATKSCESCLRIVARFMDKAD